MVKMRNRNLLTNIPNSLPNICADEQRLTQIILNLVDNSIKYSTEKAAITISVRQDTNLDNILFQVTDTGFGIPPDKQIEIFNPYARIRKAEEHTTGLGIGLSLSRTLVELHGGQIWFETSEGIGSSFYFTIPKYTRKHMTTAFKKGQPDENCHN
jgi:signal transduction histidine kinase